MRTLQEKYNAIQEGKFSKDQFLVEARMQQPQLVTRYNGYRDAVQILKNRGMIQESSAEESFADYSNDALNDMIINMSRYEGNEEEITRIKSELQRRKETLEEANLGHNEISSIHQEGGSWIVTYRKDGTKEKVFKTEKEARAFEKTLSEARRKGVVKEAGGHASINNLSKFHGITGDKLPEDKEGLEKALKAAEEGGNKRTAQEIRIALKKLNEAKKQSITIIFDIAPEKEEIKYIRKILTNAGVNATVKKGEYDEVMVITADNTSELNKAKRVLNREIADDFEWGKQLNEAKQTKLTKKSLTDYRYKPTNDMDKYPYEQILRGLRVELEAMGVQGTPTAEEYAKALAKVSKNLAKDSIFYTNQLAGVNPKVDQHDQMVDATAKNTVDTFNGMKKIKDLKEDHSKNPNDKYVVKFSKANNTYQVWEGDHLVTDFATNERAKAYADRENKKQGLSESALKEGFKKLIKKVLSEEVIDVESYKEDIYEMQGPKEDSYYKSELSDYLDDNGIFGYTDRIHNIMTGPDEAENVDELVRFLEDNQIYGYNRGIERIYSDYPYDEHWMNQPDEDQADESI
jgi:hypothetical protein